MRRNYTGTIRLKELSPEKLTAIDAWKNVNNIEGEEEVVTPDLLEAYESLIAPAEKDANRLILPTNRQVWCLVNAVFANGQKHIGVSLCEADSDVGPISWSVWNGQEFVNLLLPPAPDFVLEVDGPDNFCKRFDTSHDEVFPLIIMVVPQFQQDPHQRKVTLLSDGTHI